MVVWVGFCESDVGFCEKIEKIRHRGLPKETTKTKVVLAQLPASWTLDTFADFAVVARASFRGSRPKVLASREKGDNGMFLRTEGFPQITRKGSRNGRKDRNVRHRKPTAIFF